MGSGVEGRRCKKVPDRLWVCCRPDGYLIAVTDAGLHIFYLCRPSSTLLSTTIELGGNLLSSESSIESAYQQNDWQNMAPQIVPYVTFHNFSLAWCVLHLERSKIDKIWLHLQMLYCTSLSPSSTFLPITMHLCYSQSVVFAAFGLWQFHPGMRDSCGDVGTLLRDARPSLHIGIICSIYSTHFKILKTLNTWHRQQLFSWMHHRHWGKHTLIFLSFGQRICVINHICPKFKYLDSQSFSRGAAWCRWDGRWV